MNLILAVRDGMEGGKGSIKENNHGIGTDNRQELGGCVVTALLE